MSWVQFVPSTEVYERPHRLSPAQPEPGVPYGASEISAERPMSSLQCWVASQHDFRQPNAPQRLAPLVWYDQQLQPGDQQQPPCRTSRIPATTGYLETKQLLPPPPPSWSATKTDSVLGLESLPLGAACEVAARGETISFNTAGETPTQPVKGFGLKLLESMGWSEGEGLGRDGGGISQPVAASNKHDRLGLGAVKPPKQPPQPPRAKRLLQSKAHSALHVNGPGPGRESKPGTGRRTAAAKAGEKVRRKRRKVEQRLNLPPGSLGTWRAEQLNASSLQIMAALGK